MGRVLLVALAIAVVAAFGAAPAAQAHIIHSNGTWSYKYMTRGSSSDCGGSGGKEDPLNVLFWQYGEGNRMNSHMEADTDLGFYSAPGVVRKDQWICGDSDSAVGNYTVNVRDNFDDQQGHGGIYCTCRVRAHARIFYAPHSHTGTTDKWSIIDAHHAETVFCSSTALCHKIDEDWETWEIHIGAEFGSSGHNFYYDYWARQGNQMIKGFFDDGFITRVGGLHNGVY